MLQRAIVRKTRSGVRVAHVEVLFVGERKRGTEDEEIKGDEERYIHSEIAKIDLLIDRLRGGAHDPQRLLQSVSL